MLLFRLILNNVTNIESDFVEKLSISEIKITNKGINSIVDLIAVFEKYNHKHLKMCI